MSENKSKKIRSVSGFSTYTSLDNLEIIQKYVDRKSLNKDYFFVIILEGNKFAGYVEAQVSEELATIVYTEIYPEYRGKGLCSILLDTTFDIFDQRNIESVEIVNIGGLKGFYCYTNSGKRFGYRYKCEDVDQFEEGCISMLFQRNSYDST